jgi:hypothetical protein
MENEEPKQRPKRSSEDRLNPVTELVSYFVDQLALAFGQLVPPQRSVLYCHALADLSEKQLIFGFEKILKFWKPEFGKTFPSPAEIREWAVQWRPEIAGNQKLLERGEKPPDWEPLSAEEIERLEREAGLRPVPILPNSSALPRPNQRKLIELTEQQWQERLEKLAGQKLEIEAK